MATVVGALAGVSIVGASSPAAAAYRSRSYLRAARLAAIAAAAALEAALLMYVGAQSGWPAPFLLAALGAAAALAGSGVVVYRQTPEVDRLDTLLLALLTSIAFAPLVGVFYGLTLLIDLEEVGRALTSVVYILPFLLIAGLVGLGTAVALQRLRTPARPVELRSQSAQRRRAEEAAKLLLRDVLGEQEARQTAARGYIELEGAHCRYRIYPGSFRTAVLNKKGRWIGNLCLVPANNVPIPDYDQLLAKALMLRHAEAEFWSQANLIDSGPEAWEIRQRLCGEGRPPRPVPTAQLPGGHPEPTQLGY